MPEYSRFQYASALAYPEISLNTTGTLPASASVNIPHGQTGTIPHFRLWFELFPNEISFGFVSSVQYSSPRPAYEASSQFGSAVSVNTTNIVVDNLGSPATPYYLRVYKGIDDNNINVGTPKPTDKVLDTVVGSFTATVSGLTYGSVSMPNPTGTKVLPFSSFSFDDGSTWSNDFNGEFTVNGSIDIMTVVTASTVTYYWSGQINGSYSIIFNTALISLT